MSFRFGQTIYWQFKSSKISYSPLATGRCERREGCWQRCLEARGPTRWSRRCQRTFRIQWSQPGWLDSGGSCSLSLKRSVLPCVFSCVQHFCTSTIYSQFFPLVYYHAHKCFDVKCLFHTSLSSGFLQIVFTFASEGRGFNNTSVDRPLNWGLFKTTFISSWYSWLSLLEWQNAAKAQKIFQPLQCTFSSSDTWLRRLSKSF